MKKKNKKILKTFLKDNKVLVAALSGAAAGITVAGILGTEKAQEIIRTVEDSVANMSDRIQNGTRNTKKEYADNL